MPSLLTPFCPTLRRLPRLALLALCALVPATILCAEVAKPNVLVFLVDDLRPEIGTYERRHMITPHMDRLAREGLRFDRAFCQVPVCGASRASLLTGLFPTPTRFLSYSTRADKDAPGIADIPTWLRRHGYQTHAMGKVYHVNDDNRASWDRFNHPLIKNSYYSDYALPESRRQPDAPQRQAWGGGMSWESADVPDDAYHTGQLTQAAIKRMREARTAEDPFFLVLGYVKPHLPFAAPKKYWDLYRREDIVPAPNNFPPKGAPEIALHNNHEMRAYRDIPATGPIPPDLATTLQHGYYACVSYTDAQIGLVMAELKRLELSDNTIVILAGDHGYQLGEHSLWIKHNLFETSLRVPLIVLAPGKSSGRSSNALVDLVDLYPTICELTGTPPPEHLQGRSFVPLLRDPDLAWKDASYSRYESGDSVRTDRYRYSEWTLRDGTAHRMLYDLEKDPDENENVAEHPAYAETVSHLAALLKRGPLIDLAAP